MQFTLSSQSRAQVRRPQHPAGVCQRMPCNPANARLPQVGGRWCGRQARSVVTRVASQEKVVSPPARTSKIAADVTQLVGNTPMVS